MNCKRNALCGIYIFVYCGTVYLLFVFMACVLPEDKHFKLILHHLSLVLQVTGFWFGVSPCWHTQLTAALKNASATKPQRPQTARTEDLLKFLPVYLLKFRSYSCRTTVSGESTKTHSLQRRYSKSWTCLIILSQVWHLVLSKNWGICRF